MDRLSKRYKPQKFYSPLKEAKSLIFSLVFGQPFYSWKSCYSFWLDVTINFHQHTIEKKDSRKLLLVLQEEEDNYCNASFVSLGFFKGLVTMTSGYVFLRLMVGHWGSTKLIVCILKITLVSFIIESYFYLFGFLRVFFTVAYDGLVKIFCQ